MGFFAKHHFQIRKRATSVLLVLICGMRAACWQTGVLPQRGGSMARFVTVPPEGRDVTLIVQTTAGRWVVPVPYALRASMNHAIATGSQSAVNKLLQSVLQRTWYDPLWSVAERYRVNLKPLPPITPESSFVRFPAAAQVTLQEAIVLVGGPYYHREEHQLSAKHAAIARHAE